MRFPPLKSRRSGSMRRTSITASRPGLMDQMASSVGGLVFIDFNDPKMPVVEKVDYDFAHSGYTLCTIDAGADHADLTDEYAAIPAEMKQVARFFGKEVLREVDEKEFYARNRRTPQGNRRPRGAARHPLLQREPARAASGARAEKRPFRCLSALRQRVRSWRRGRFCRT